MNKFLTTKELLELSGVSRNTLYRDIKNGKIKSLAGNMANRFSIEDAERYAEEKKGSFHVKLWQEKKNSTQPKN